MPQDGLFERLAVQLVEVGLRTSELRDEVLTRLRVRPFADRQDLAAFHPTWIVTFRDELYARPVLQQLKQPVLEVADRQVPRETPFLGRIRAVGPYLRILLTTEQGTLNLPRQTVPDVALKRDDLLAPPVAVFEVPPDDAIAISAPAWIEDANLRGHAVRKQRQSKRRPCRAAPAHVDRQSLPR